MSDDSEVEEFVEMLIQNLSIHKLDRILPLIEKNTSLTLDELRILKEEIENLDQPHEILDRIDNLFYICYLKALTKYPKSDYSIYRYSTEVLKILRSHCPGPLAKVLGDELIENIACNLVKCKALEELIVLLEMLDRFKKELEFELNDYIILLGSARINGLIFPKLEISEKSSLIECLKAIDIFQYYTYDIDEVREATVEKACKWIEIKSGIFDTGELIDVQIDKEGTEELFNYIKPIRIGDIKLQNKVTKIASFLKDKESISSSYKLLSGGNENDFQSCNLNSESLSEVLYVSQITLQDPISVTNNNQTGLKTGIWKGLVSSNSKKIVVTKVSNTSGEKVYAIIKDAKILKNLSGKNHSFLNYCGSPAYESDKLYYRCIIMEDWQMDFGTWIAKRKELGNFLSPIHFSGIVHYLLDAFCYLRKSKIYHQDMKPQNILISNNSELKISDFGMSQCIEFAQTEIETESGIKNTKATLNYMSPEQRQDYNQRTLMQSCHIKYSREKADVFSLGLAFLELYTLEDLRKVNMIEEESKRVEKINSIVDKIEVLWIKRLLMKMLCFEYTKRKRFKKLLKYIKRDEDFINHLMRCKYEFPTNSNVYPKDDVFKSDNSSTCANDSDTVVSKLISSKVLNIPKDANASCGIENTFEPKNSTYNAQGDALNNLGRKGELTAQNIVTMKVQPNEANNYHNRGIILGNLGRCKESIECFDTAIRLKPDFAESYYCKGSLLNDLGRKEEAIECYDASIRAKPDFTLAYINKGNALSDLGRKEEAIEYFDIAIKLKSSDATAYNNKGLALNDLGRKEEAIDNYDAAIRLKPDFALVYTNKGNALNDLGRWKEALTCFEAVIRLEPDSAESYNIKGVTLNDLGRKEEAIACYDSAIRLKPDYADVYNNKAAALSSLGRNEEAIEWIDTSIRLNSGSAGAHNNKGTILNVLGRRKEAIECYDIALRLDPNYDISYLNKGHALYGLGRYDEAIRCYDTVMGLESNSGRKEEENAAIRLKPYYADAMISKANAIKQLGRK